MKHNHQHLNILEEELMLDLQLNYNDSSVLKQSELMENGLDGHQSEYKYYDFLTNGSVALAGSVDMFDQGTS